jgi:hypothetical protein
MAVIGSAHTPYVQGTIENLEPYPVGGMNTPFVAGIPDGFVSIKGNRFPVPPVAWAFMTTLDPELVFDLKGTNGAHHAGALLPESGRLEPTIGQIWPRIG